MSLGKPIRNCFLVCYSLLDLVDETPLAFRPGCSWGTTSQVEVLKVGAPDVCFRPFTSQGEAGSDTLPPTCVSLHQGGVG